MKSKTHSIKSGIISFLAFILYSIALPSSALTSQADFNHLIVFGDSLSDPGNAFVLTGQTSVRPFNTSNIPDAPYARGGMHFSNGSTWIEQLANTLGMTPGGSPAVRVPGKFTNYAVGSSRARSGSGAASDLTTQVTQFMADAGDSAPADALYAMWFGGNDVRDAIVAVSMSGNPASAIPIITAAVTAIADNITALTFAGAARFLVPNVPNLGTVPAITALGPDAIFLATSLTVAFNTALEGALTGLEGALPIEITRLDVFSLIGEAVAAPDAAGFSNVTDACITPDVIRGAFCRQPDGYLFWDGIHPTYAAHTLIKDEALLALGWSN